MRRLALGAGLRRWAGMRRIAKLAAAGAGGALLDYANGCADPELGLLAQGAYGRQLFYASKLKEANAVFSALRAQVKQREDRRSGYINIFCLCYLSLLRGTAGYNDAAMFTKRARTFRPGARLRALLPMPDLPERVFPGGVASWVDHSVASGRSPAIVGARTPGVSSAEPTIPPAT